MTTKDLETKLAHLGNKLDGLISARSAIAGTMTSEVRATRLFTIDKAIARVRSSIISKTDELTVATQNENNGQSIVRTRRKPGTRKP